MYCTMEKKPYTIRLDSELLELIKSIAEQRGETVTAIFEQALKSFLSAPNRKDDQVSDPSQIEALRQRVERLEAIVANKPDTAIDTDQLGELITKQEAAAITGYSVNTLNRTFSQNNILEVEKRGKAGLYRKDEVLNRIGIK